MRNWGVVIEFSEKGFFTEHHPNLMVIGASLSEPLIGEANGNFHICMYVVSSVIPYTCAFLFLREIFEKLCNYAMHNAAWERGYASSSLSAGIRLRERTQLWKRERTYQLWKRERERASRSDYSPS